MFYLLKEKNINILCYLPGKILPTKNCDMYVYITVCVFTRFVARLFSITFNDTAMHIFSKVDTIITRCI